MGRGACATRLFYAAEIELALIGGRMLDRAGGLGLLEHFAHVGPDRRLGAAVAPFSDLSIDPKNQGQE